MKKALILLAAMMLLVPATLAMSPPSQQVTASQNQTLYVGILIQDNVLRVGNDLSAYRNFVEQLPAGSHVAVAYARAGTNVMVQPFTTDRSKAAKALRPPTGFSSTAPGSPYVSLKQFIKKYPSDQTGIRKVVVFVSDGLDPNYGGGIQTLPSANPYLRQAIKVAKEGDVTVFSIFAPGGGEMSESQQLAFSGQGSLNYLSESTDGQAFFSGGTYVTATPFLKDIAAKLG